MKEKLEEERGVGLPTIELKRIIEKCKRAAGHSMSVMEKSDRNNQSSHLCERVGIEAALTKVLQERAVETADKISKFSDNMPNILRIIFEEDNSRKREQSEDEVNVLREYEGRRLNLSYNMIK